MIFAPLIFALVKLALVTVAPDISALASDAPTNVEPVTFAPTSVAPVRIVLVKVEFVKVAPVRTAFVIVALANVEPVIIASAIEAPAILTLLNVEFVKVTRVIMALVIVAPAKDVPEISALVSVALARLAVVNVEFRMVEPDKSTFVRVAPANETLVTVVLDNEAPVILTLSNTCALVMADPCNDVPASATVTTHEMLGGALYNDDAACDATIVAVPAPLSVTTPVEEFTTRTLLESGLLNAYDFTPALALVTATVNGASVTFLDNVAAIPVSAVVPFSTVRVHVRSFCVEYCEFVFWCPVIMTVPTLFMVMFAIFEIVDNDTTLEIFNENDLLAVLSLIAAIWNAASP